MASNFRAAQRPSQAGKPPPKPKHNWINKTTRASRQRSRMLDKSKENYFRYDMDELLKRGNVPDERRAALASTLFAKGSRGTTDDAKEFAQEKRAEGLYDDDTYNGILRLLEGYSTWR